jgi:hypothetical protein
MNFMSSLHETSAQFVHMGFDTAEGAWQAFDAYEGDTHFECPVLLIVLREKSANSCRNVESTLCI